MDIWGHGTCKGPEVAESLVCCRSARRAMCEGNRVKTWTQRSGMTPRSDCSTALQVPGPCKEGLGTLLKSKRNHTAFWARKSWSDLGLTALLSSRVSLANIGGLFPSLPCPGSGTSATVGKGLLCKCHKSRSWPGGGWGVGWGVGRASILSLHSLLTCLTQFPSWVLTLAPHLLGKALATWCFLSLLL